MGIAILSCHDFCGGFLSGLLCDPLYGYCSGLLHVHDSHHKHPRGCGSIHGPHHGPLHVQSHVLLNGPVHFPSCGMFQSPVLCPGPYQSQSCSHEGNKCHCLLKERKSPFKLKIYYKFKFSSPLPLYISAPPMSYSYFPKSPIFSSLYHHFYSLSLSLFVALLFLYLKGQLSLLLY